MRELAATVDEIPAFILDMDGVLYIGEAPIEGAAEAVEWLRERGKKLVFSTNNSTNTRGAYVRKLARMDIRARESEMVTSAYATALYLRRHSPRAKIYVIGERGLKLELKWAGIGLVSYDRADEATHVVVGMDRTVDNKKLTGGLRAILAGAEFIATNADATYPTETGLSPGAGAMVGALVGCSGRSPKVVIGKPSPRMIKIALGALGSKPGETAIVGDRLDTDMMAGKRAGLTTILVLSGVSKKRDVVKFRKKVVPDFVIESLRNLMVS